MTIYFLKRLLLIIPTLLGIMLLNFFIIQIAPGGPVEQTIAKIKHSHIDANANINQAGLSDVIQSDEKTKSGLPPELIKEIEIEHFLLPLASKNPFTIWRNIKRIRRIIREKKINVVHARSRAPAWSAYKAAKKENVKFVTTFHGLYSNNWLFPFSLIKHAYNKIMVKGEKVVAVSEFIKEHILKTYKTPEDKIVVITRGTRTDYFSPDAISDKEVEKARKLYQLPKGKFLIFMPARISSWKGQSLLLDALNILSEDEKFTTKFYCVLIGADSGDYELENSRIEEDKNLSEIIYKIEKHQLHDKVKIIPTQNDLRPFYKMADLVVSASKRPEAFGRVTCEMQSMQGITLATNLGGSKETIIAEENGFLCDVDKHKMAQHIKNIISMNKAERQRMGQKARRHIEKHYSFEQMLEKNEELYSYIKSW